MISNCRSCSSSDLGSVVNLGDQHLSDFRKDKSKPNSFPLNLLICGICNLVQLDTTVSRNLMYHDGYGYKSGINELIVKNLKKLIDYGMELKKNPSSWLDIACNDGTLLSMLPSGIFRVGVDPVKKFKELSKVHADLIIDDFFPSDDTQNLPSFDVITSISMFYDLDDPNQFVKDVKNKLASDGIWIVQQNYLLAMLQNNSFDNICHEHIEYYSLKAMIYLMEKNDLEIFDVFLDEINGGSLITAIAHKGTKEVTSSVELQLKKETEFGLETMKPYQEFESRVKKIKLDLIDLLLKLKSTGQRVQIYGASTRGATIWQYLNIDEKLVESAVERQQEKIGKYFSAIGIPIIGEDQMRIDPPDYLLVGPWFLKESFVKREAEFLSNGGKFIFPLPEIEIIEL
jgi:NDP-4-keto-2,6-dideoxyhexose 3-C-methyltransferase